jgi:hypothetical protein
LLIIALFGIGLIILIGMMIYKRDNADRPPIPTPPCSSDSPRQQGAPISCVTISDWTTFLTSEKHGLLGSILSFAAVLIALIAILLSSSVAPWDKVINGIIALVLTLNSNKDMGPDWAESKPCRTNT